jgi:molecular chaperone GrpE
MLGYGELPRKRRIPVCVVGDEDQTAVAPVGDVSPSPEAVPVTPGTEGDWRSLAVRLQSEMAGFRKRQERRAHDASAIEKDRLLRRLLPVLDNLGRALNHGAQDRDTLMQGVELTYRELVHLLETEGVAPIEAQGRPFSPEVHDAVSTVADPARAGTVAEVVEPGYTVHDRLLRPARVIVAA